MSTSDNSVLFSLSRLASQRFVAVGCLYGLSSTHVSRQTMQAVWHTILQHSRVMSYAFYQFRSFLLFLSFGVFLVDVNHKDMRLSCESELFLAPITRYSGYSAQLNSVKSTPSLSSPAISAPA